MNATKVCLVTAEAQGVHEAEGHSVGTPAETALARVESWENVGRNASANEVLKKFENATRERNGAVGIKRSGVTISLDDRNHKTGLPCERNHREPQHKVEERKQKMTPPRERTLKREYGKQSAPGADSWHLESAATSSLQEKGASNLPDSCKDVRDAMRREIERKNSSETKSPQWERKNGRAKGNVPRQEGGHCIWQRSGVTPEVRKVRRMREDARFGARRERDVTEPSHSFQKRSWRNELCYETVDGRGEVETNLILRRPGAAKVTP